VALRDRYRAFEYLHEELPDLYAAADLYVGRAGAGSLWECAAAGVPMVLVPLAGSGTRGDQVENARWFASKNAARVLEGGDADDPESLIRSCGSFLGDPERLNQAVKAIRTLGAQDAEGVIAERLLSQAFLGMTP